MALNRYYGIQDLLEPGIYTVRIKVKVSRRWTGNASQNQPVRGISMFLTDSFNYRIYCWIPSNLAEFYTDELEEGKSYEIHNFMISTYRSSCKCADNEFFMIMMNSTIVLPLQRDQCVVATETFNFTALSQLDIEHFQEDHCIDVIGILGRRGTMDFFMNKHNEEEVYLDFEITDHINETTVRLRNGIAQLCNNAFNTLNENHVEPTTISISCCKMQFNRYRKQIFLIDAPATRIFINYESEEDSLLRQRFREMKDPRE